MEEPGPSRHRAPIPASPKPCPGRSPPIDALLVHPRRGVPGGHDLEPHITELTLQPARPDCQHAAYPRLSPAVIVRIAFSTWNRSPSPNRNASMRVVATS